MATGLRQTDIPHLDPRTVGRIERGYTRATFSALTSLAAAHKMSVDDYMGALAGRL